MVTKTNRSGFFRSVFKPHHTFLPLTPFLAEYAHSKTKGIKLV